MISSTSMGAYTAAIFLLARLFVAEKGRALLYEFLSIMNGYLMITFNFFLKSMNWFSKVPVIMKSKFYSLGFFAITENFVV